MRLEIYTVILRLFEFKLIIIPGDYLVNEKKLYIATMANDIAH